MVEHMTENTRQGVLFVISIINDFARIPFPGTDIPVAVLVLTPAVIWFIWRKVTVWLYGGELH